MSIKTRLQSDINAAMRAGDKARLGVLRLANAAIKQREIDSRRTLDDAGVQAVIEKMIKQGKDAAAQFESAGRTDLAAKENAEIAYLDEYMPEPLSAASIAALVDDVIRDTGAKSIKDLGKVMAAIKDQAAGRVDMADVNRLVRRALEAD